MKKLFNHCCSFLFMAGLLLVFLLPDTPYVCDAALTCANDQFCESQLREGSFCNENGVCSNPFFRGCLNKLYPGVDKARVCNSDDGPANIANGDCVPSQFNYTEIRVHHANWESAIFFAWIIQIVLMEVLRVPVTVGFSSNHTLDASFYNPNNILHYSSEAYTFDGLRRANEIHDCRKVQNGESCVHLLPEVWNGQAETWQQALQDGYIEPVEGNGMVGKGSWYVPGFVATEDETLVSFYGLRGEENRHKLAKAFKRPATWQQYCEEVSPSNCSIPDETADHYPSESETGKYFSDLGYNGYFRITDAGNCTMNPQTCTGHIVSPVCTWSVTIESQLYWNNIVGLASDGPNPPNGAYLYSSLVELWRAANATKSPIILWWWRPEALVEEFHGSDAEFQQVLLPEATHTCAKARPNEAARCSDNIWERRGDPAGACDQEAHALQKVITGSLRIISNFDTTGSGSGGGVEDSNKNSVNDNGENEASKSPAYEFIQNIKLTDLQLNEMLRNWIGSDKIDLYGNDAREAVCSWVADNYDVVLQDFIPPTYPRYLSSDQSSSTASYLLAAQYVGVIAMAIVLIFAVLTFYWRHTQVFVYAQVYFVFLILFGFICITIGAVTTVQEPSQTSCTATQWFVVLGYTIELVPLLVKIAAINTILQSARKLKRVQISPRSMMMRVTVVVILVMIYLVLWTLLDPPQRVEQRVIAGPAPTTTTLDSEGRNVEMVDDMYVIVPGTTTTIVESSLECASNLEFWFLFGLGWEAILLVCATVLAIQSRNVLQEFNESQSLGTMIYSHFLFIVLRIVVYFLNSTFSPSVIAAVQSFLLSFDTLFAISIYLIPKFLQAMDNSTAIAQLNGTASVAGQSGNSTAASHRPYRFSRKSNQPIA